MASNNDLIIKLRAETAQLRKDLNKAKAQMGTFGKNVNKIGASIRNSMLTAFGGLAVLQGIRSVISNLAEFELQMAKVSAISGASAMEMESLTENALELGRTTKFTAGEIASLQLELSKLGFDTSQILAATDAIQQLSLVTGEDLAESAKSMAGTLRSFNLEADQSARVSNAMAESFSKSALTLEKFTVGTANSGAIANALGVTLEQNTARLGALVDANIDASKAGTDLRKIYIELNKAGLNYETALSLVEKSSDKVATATELVGIRAAGALVILSENRDKVKDLGLELSDTNVEMGGMADTINDTLSVSFDKLKSAIDGTIKEGSVFNDWLKKATDLATEFVQRQSESISDTQFRIAIEKGAETWKKYTQNVGTANQFLSSHKDELDRLKRAITTYEMKLRLNGKTLNKTKKEYRDLKAEFLELNSTMEEAKKVVDRHNEQLKIETDLLAKEAAAAKEATKEIAALNAIKSEGAELEDTTGKQASISGGVTELPIPTLTSEQINAAVEENKFQMGVYSESWKMQVGNFIDIAKGLNSTLSNIMISTFASIGEAIGGGNNSTAKAMDKIKKVIANGMKSIGAAMISFAIAKIAFDKAIFSNPYAALAAGAALVVAGAALSASIDSANSSMQGGGGGGGGGGSRGGGRGNFSAERTEKTIKIEGLVSGRNLALVLANENQNKSRNGG